GCLAAQRGFEVKHDALLVAIEAEENRALVPDEGRTHPAREIARGRLDLDDPGTGVAELHRAKGATETLRKVNDANAVETSRASHFDTPAPRSSTIPSSVSNSAVCSPGLPPARIGPAGARS